jgi:hypothetical protein
MLYGSRMQAYLWTAHRPSIAKVPTASFTIIIFKFEDKARARKQAETHQPHQAHQHTHTPTAVFTEVSTTWQQQGNVTARLGAGVGKTR